MKLNLKNGKLTIMASLLIMNSSFVFTGCTDKSYESGSIVTQSKNIDDSDNPSEIIISNNTFDEISNNENEDETILKYYEEEEKEITKLLEFNDKDIKQKVSEKIVILIDFLFYDGEIKGITVDEISDETKEKLIFITSKIDDKIDSFFPDYKEKISDKCREALVFIKEKGKNGINKLDDYLDRKIDNYDDIKDGVQSVISDTKDDFNEVKDLVNSGVSKVKNYYENWRDKIKTTND